MSENRKDLFVVTEEGAASSGTRSLAGSAQLTALSTQFANEVMAAVTAENFDNVELFRASTVDANEHDRLIQLYSDVNIATDDDLQFLVELTDETKTKLLRSRQSTRSHCKSKPMTLDNYRTMTINAVGELLLRRVLNAPKMLRTTSGGPRTAILFTAEELSRLAEDQGEVRREIRNLASRKSIYKHSAQFDENSEIWQQILTAEEQLKSIRTDMPRGHSANGVVKAKVLEVLGGKDITTLKANEAKQLLGTIAGLVGMDTTTEDLQ